MGGDQRLQLVNEEDRIISTISRRFGTRGAEVLLGIGDDAAVLTAPLRNIVVSVDACVEGTHFDRKIMSLQDVGRRALVAALSDLAAMGAHPNYYLVSLQSPNGRSEVLALHEGLHRAATAYGMRLIGGNLSRGRHLSIHTTVLGFAGRGRILTRAGAQPGNGIYITGRLGGPAWGLKILRSGRRNLSRFEKSAVNRFLRPKARFDASAALVRSGMTTAAIDISDGLLLDLERLCRASGVRANIMADLIPTCPGLPSPSRHTNPPLWSGGDEYEILCTVDERGLKRWPPPLRLRMNQLFTRIGTIERGRGVRLYYPDGREVEPAHMKHAGWDHWGN